MENFKLTPQGNFTFYELTNSTSYPNLVEANRKDAMHFINNLTMTAIMAEQVRSILGVGMKVSSGHRYNILNGKVGGSKTSKHMQALCIDFVPIGMSVNDAFNLLVKNKDKLTKAHKVIIEGVKGKLWIHIQVRKSPTEKLTFMTTTDGVHFQEVK